MEGRVVRRVPASVSTSFAFLVFVTLFRRAGLTALLAGLSGGPAAAELVPWPATLRPPLALDTLDDKRVNLADLSDHVVVVHFFATWCEPCRPELSALDRLSKAFEGQSLAILAVDSGEPEGRVRRFFREVPVSYPILLDSDQAGLKAWGVTTFPTSFVVGSNGQPLFVAEGEVAWETDTILTTITKLLVGTGESPRSQLPAMVERPQGQEGEVQ